MVTIHVSATNWLWTMGAGLISLVLVLVVGACASEAPKGPSEPTADQVRSHADRAFEKLKQEERGRAAQPPMP
ncbi:MAG: hypothetical protein NT179_04555 [Nitrospirae bacterium]|nr:hypothetical protein [Nitrospirota bacterium]